MEENVSKINEAPIDEECLSPWRDYRNGLITQKNDLEKDIDKTVFTVSSGAIAISLTIVDKLAPSNSYKWFYFVLAVGWLTLVISLILQSLSYFATAKKIRESILKVENIINSETTNDLEIYQDKYYDYWKAQNKSIDKMNSWSLGTMIGGVILVLSFAILSVSFKEEKATSNGNAGINKLDSLKIKK